MNNSFSKKLKKKLILKKVSTLENYNINFINLNQLLSKKRFIIFYRFLKNRYTI